MRTSEISLGERYHKVKNRFKSMGIFPGGCKVLALSFEYFGDVPFMLSNVSRIQTMRKSESI